MQQFYKKISALGLLIFLSATGFSQTVKSYGVMIKREGTTAPVKLVWDYDNTTTSYSIYRKTPGQLQWGSAIATNAPTDTFYTDNITTGNYEYYVQRNLINSKRGHGYIFTSANNAPLVKANRLMLAIDANYVMPLANEINQLIKDLAADGWFVDTIHVQRNTNVTLVKQRISNWFNTYKNDDHKPQQLYLLGRIPVPYSGVIFPDGHTPDHKGAWPADVYYGVMNEDIWTDNSANFDSATLVRNKNIPADGKFDVDFIFPDSSSLEIGRVDLTSMPLFGESDTVLTRNYLNRAHQFKTLGFVPNRKAVVDNNFGVMDGEAFASSGYRNFSTMIGNENIVDGDLLTSIKKESHLLAYGCGGGTYTSASGIGNSSNFVSDSINAVYMMLFGSYFGDWDNNNNFLRAPLCSKPMSLATMWSGRPHWNLHHMSLGYTIGHAAKLAQNNVDGRLLTPVSVSGYFSSFFPSYVHVALMGDPSLRLFYNPIPQNVVATPNPDSTSYNLSWNAVPGAVGYQVFRSLNPMYGGDAIYTTTNPSVTITNLFPGVNHIYVRAQFIETSASGAYNQLSLGEYIEINGGVNAVGLMEKSTTKIDLTVYPNPTKNWFSVAGEFLNANIQVFDITGKLVLENNSINSHQPITHQLQIGIYIVKVTQNNKTAFTKLVVN
ncbi:MAG: T9SS type A sorting domain-containing protein [Bacteroidia bacterium]|nr:T9SS type A sorting domain-containing protein [Bacteroidia bacterium]MBP9689362.1 T9SS type A sorting domain-containing protein [Bacteroidia bacterium]